MSEVKNKQSVVKPKVRMIFSEDKFYNDLTKAHFVKDKIYTVEGQDMIDRWLKRGGKIVEDKPVKEASAPTAPTKPDQKPTVDPAAKAPVAPAAKPSEDKNKPASK